MENSWRFKAFACAELNDVSNTDDNSDNYLEQEGSTDGSSSYGDDSAIDDVEIQSFDNEEDGIKQYVHFPKIPTHDPDTVASTPKSDCGEIVDFSKRDEVLTSEDSIGNYDDSSFSWRSILESERSFSSSITADENDNSFASSASTNRMKNRKSLTDYATDTTEEEQIQNHGDAQVENSSFEDSTTAEDKYDIETILDREYGDSLKTNDNLTEEEESLKLHKLGRRQPKKSACIKSSSSSWYYGSFIICMSILIIYFSLRLHRMNSYGDSNPVLNSPEKSNIDEMEKLQYIASERHKAEP